MSAIAGIIHWDGRPVEKAHIDGMLGIVRHRGPDGLHSEVAGPAGFGEARFALRRVEPNQRPQPIWLPDRSCAIVADARLYNRDNLLRTLGKTSWFRDDPSDAEIILAGYEKWGEGCFLKLDGDFVFAIWEPAKKRLLAARDPFGAKPLFFHHDEHRFAFGTQAKQLLILPGVPVEADDQTVGEFLFNRYLALDRSFFRSIHRLPPAHHFAATTQGVARKHYWSLKPGRELSYPRQQDYFDGFRDHLNRAVTRRLQTDYTIAAELSGGFDSSSVVVTAGEIYRTTPERLPPFETLSRVFGEMACDESDYIRAVNERVPFNSNCFSPPEEVGYEGVVEEQWRTDTPAAHLPGGETLHMRRIFSAIGARTLLTGLGGDEVVWDNDYVNDLAACGRYLDYLKASRRVSAGPGAWLNSLARSALRWMTPSPARRLYRNSVGGSWRPPDWAQPETIERFSRYLRSVEQVSAGFPTPSQNAAARGVQSPRLLWELETLESRRVHQGVELRHPFLDRALAEYVLAIPFAQRLPPGGQRKYLTRRGLGSLLPDIVRLREYKTPFSAFENERIRKSREMTEGEIFGSDRWVSARYVSKERSAGLWRQYRPPGTATRLVNQPLEAVATLELWLRNLGRYEEQKLP